MTDDKGAFLWRIGCRLEDEGKLEEAVRSYERAVERGSVEAMIRLARLHTHGNPPNVELALQLLETAASHGSARAARDLAMHYRDMDDEIQEIKWMKEAALLAEDIG